MKKRVSREMLTSFTFDYTKEPVLTVKEGELFVVETQDNTGGRIRSENELPTVEFLKPNSDFDPGKFNPVSGPIYIEGARRGDLLEISIHEIIPSETGVTLLQEGRGPCANSRKWPELGENYTKIIRHIPGPSGTLRDGVALYSENLSWPLSPFIGTIGVAPDFEIHSSMAGQLPCAGNWDSRDMKEGSKLYVNCYHDGALLFLGDVHAGQGDAEWGGVAADEVEAQVTLSCRIIRNKRIPYARIEKEDSIIQLFADKPLEDAVHNAIFNLMDWMVEEYRMNPRDVYILITIHPSFRINIYQMVRDPLFKYVVGAEFPKRYLKS
ncbi:MAG: acetamidase/formamidase family protein [Spirochaetaceae bacterium]|nr:MAG: acetamidase/formamidase family protein [Spirochaetaceae bacterium]